MEEEKYSKDFVRRAYEAGSLNTIMTTNLLPVLAISFEDWLKTETDNRSLSFPFWYIEEKIGWDEWCRHSSYDASSKQFISDNDLFFCTKSLAKKLGLI